MHGLRAMRPATGRLFKPPDRRFMVAALGALAINAAVAIGLVTLTTQLAPFNRPILPMVATLLEPEQPLAPKETPPPPPPPQIKPATSVTTAPQARPVQVTRAETKQVPASIANPAAAPQPAAGNLPAPGTQAASAPMSPAPAAPAPAVNTTAAPPGANAIAVPQAVASVPGSDATNPAASSPGPRQAAAAGSAGLSEPARRTGPRVDASWTGNAAPAYPPSARRMCEQGRVKLDVHVGLDGAVIDVQLRESSGSAALDRSAMEAVRKWRFRPAMVDGQPLAEWYRNWEWIFRLEG